MNFQENGYSIINIEKKLILLLTGLLPFTSSWCDYFPKNSTKINLDIDLMNKLILAKDKSREGRTVYKNKSNELKKTILELTSKSGIKARDIFLDDIYFRATNPNDIKTQSIVHRDCWFHAITDKWKDLTVDNNLKIWVPLYLTSEYGLGVIPGSHKDYPYDIKVLNQDDQLLFQPTIKRYVSELTPLKAPIGSAIVFPPTLIHGGLDLKYNSPRLSAEITLIVK